MKKTFLRDAAEFCGTAVADPRIQEVDGGTTARSRNGLDSRRAAAGDIRKNGQVRPLCYEHHVVMQFSRSIATPDGPKRVHGYLCPEAGCTVGYNRREGYFMMIPTRAYTERDIIPCVSCARDGQLMYLAQTNPENRSFRLWKCPVCKMSRTNREVLTV